MKKVGNVASNQIYNPQNKKPPVPIDADEADSAMERFIRSKYVQSGTTNGAKQPRSASMESDEGTPPPLPPKTGGRFSFKSGSSTFPLSFRSKRESRSREGPTSPNGSSEYGSNTLRSKSSKVFGSNVYNDSTEAMAQKLTQLRDMGFVDDKRNAMVLKGVNGNLEKTIEALVRLGEGGGSSSAPFATSQEDSLPTSRSLTPQPTPTTTFGLSKASPTASRSPTTPSNNPWDISPAPPQSSQSTGTMQNKNPFFSSNPFGGPSNPPDFNLNQSLQNLSLAPSPQQQTLFPHHTGGLPSTQPQLQPHQFYQQQSMTPPMPQTQQFTTAVYGNGQTYSPPMPQAQQQQVQQNYNPFLQAPGSQPLSVNTMQLQSQNPYGGSGNPFTRSPSSIASPSLNQIPEQSQQNVYNSPQSVYASNPFFTNAQPVQQPVMQQQYYQPQPQPQHPAQAFSQQVYQPQRSDKAAIMALYNMPSTAPVSPAQGQVQSTGFEGGQVGMTQSPPHSPPRAANPSQRSVSVPLPGNNNPFLNNGMAPAGPATAFPGVNTSGATSSARTRDSMALGMEMAWNNGRHSPDAFASLSARTG